MSRPPTRGHAEPDIVWSMPCAEMLKEVVRLMNAHSHERVGLSQERQEDVNRFMQIVSLVHSPMSGSTYGKTLRRLGHPAKK